MYSIPPQRMIAAAAVLLGLLARAARSEPAIGIHLVPAEGEVCDVDPDTLTCETLNLTGNGSQRQYAYVVLLGVNEGRSCAFGIDYEDGVELEEWIPCLSGNEIAHREWPAPDTGISMTLGGCLNGRGPDKAIVVGALVIAEGSWGRLWIQEAEPTKEAEIQGCQAPRTVAHLSEECQLAVARVHGTAPGLSPCRCSAPDENP